MEPYCQKFWANSADLLQDIRAANVITGLIQADQDIANLNDYELPDTDHVILTTRDERELRTSSWTQYKSRVSWIIVTAEYEKARRVSVRLIDLFGKAAGNTAFDVTGLSIGAVRFDESEFEQLEDRRWAYAVHFDARYSVDVALLLP